MSENAQKVSRQVVRDVSSGVLDGSLEHDISSILLGKANGSSPLTCVAAVLASIY